MKKNSLKLIDRLSEFHDLETSEYKYLIENADDAETVSYAAKKAVNLRKSIYGNKIYIRGLIEIGNVCKNNCLYCGIRGANPNCDRYRLTEEEILSCCDEGYPLGFRTFVMQGGEDAYFSDEFMCSVISKIKAKYPDCAVTLSIGERSRESYEKLYKAGADRFLLRHETATKEHYEKLHPKEMSFENRMRCLYDLKDIGFQVGCGFMVGSPYQTTEHLAADLKFIEEFSPDMCGIGPFMPAKNTPFENFSAGSATLTCFLLSLIRLIKPSILLPATTALASVEEDGRTRGILSGANVVMPNLSPAETRKKYNLYDNKKSFGSEAAESLELLRAQMSSIGYEVVVEKGDALRFLKKA